MVFGVNCSPFILNAVLRHHIEKYRNVDPDFCDRLSQSFYVDDLVTGAQSVEETHALYLKAKERMKEGGFSRRKWKTSDSALAHKIAAEEGQNMKTRSNVERAEETYAKTTLGNHDQDKSSVKILGLKWNNNQDEFEFDLGKWAANVQDNVVTKRSILSQIAKLFDPLGLISPITVCAKALFQEICVQKFDWDEDLPEEIKCHWVKMVSDLKDVDEIFVPRCLYESKANEIKSCYLHGFADASKTAYCAMIYLVYETENGFDSSLICAKTRVAPLKELSIPRLELMSARILATLMDTVRVALSSQVQIDGVYYWLDSKTALYWINNNGEWRQFVQHRVNEILKLSAKENWGHCPGIQNPADLGSRGVTANILRDSKLWWKGPEWMTRDKDHWKNDTLYDISDEITSERKKAFVHVAIAKQETGIHNIMEVGKFSSFNKLLHVTAFVLRFISNLQAKKLGKSKQANELSVQEIQEAERMWIISAQQQIRKSNNFPKISMQLGLVEENEILGCKGRLEHSELDFDAK